MKLLCISLGCDKNLVDAERMLGSLSQDGYTFTDDEQEADVILVNTCCFINDAQGRTVDFSNTVICMTSNAGSSDQSAGSLGFNKSDAQRSEEKTRKALAQFLRPEFLGRVDEVIAFKPLTEDTLQGIAALMLDEYKPGMEAKGIAYSYTPAALKALVQKSQGGRFGARDLRRTIRKAVEDPAAERLIDGTLASGGTLVVDADENGEVVLK